MKLIVATLTICAAVLFSACSYSSMGGNISLARTVTGRWMMTFTPTAQGSVMPPATTFTVNFTKMEALFPVPSRPSIIRHPRAFR